MFTQSVVLVFSACMAGYLALPQVYPDGQSPNNQAYNLPADGETLLAQALSLSFTCDSREYGYYADVSNNYQIFHICRPIEDDAGSIIETAQWSFICGNGIVFDQQTLSCNYEADSVPCDQAESLSKFTMARDQEAQDDLIRTARRSRGQLANYAERAINGLVDHVNTLTAEETMVESQVVQAEEIKEVDDILTSEEKFDKLVAKLRLILERCREHGIIRDHWVAIKSGTIGSPSRVEPLGRHQEWDHRVATKCGTIRSPAIPGPPSLLGRPSNRTRTSGWNEGPDPRPTDQGMGPHWSHHGFQARSQQPVIYH
eukprot:snap_masked-scaffold1097_size63051-processed-gene-0.8 protein:Tk07126 transcript:snap_masked-scaffold1097_size63051-processed-gene-0.8-mRNA-1 annotation:"PREDICTED: uncharacterized protein LOC100883311"